MRLGFDIGGTKIEGALVSEQGDVVKSIRVQTEAKRGKDAVISNVLSVLKQLDSDDIDYIGVGIGGFLDTDGTLACCPNISCLEGVRFGEEMAKLAGKPVFVENDANCFALAEHRFGAGKGYRNVVGLIIGTGIGAGIIIDNRLYRGSIGGAGEFGHCIIDASTDSSLEYLCSGPNIVRRYVAAGGKMESPDASKIFLSDEPVAKRVMADTYHYLGIGLANIVNALNPDIIVLGGGVSKLSFYKQLNAEMKRFSVPSLGSYARVVKHKIGDSAGVIGAAFLRG